MSARPLDALLLDASTEIALLRQRREVLQSEERAARAEIVGTEERFLALALQARRARMPRHLLAGAEHGPLAQAADGVACSPAPAPWRPREEMSAPPAPVAPSRWARFVGWALGRAEPAPQQWPLLQSYPRGTTAPGSMSAEERAAYSLDMWGLTPRRAPVDGREALGSAVGAQGILRLAK
jgi:hypothetical protein